MAAELNFFSASLLWSFLVDSFFEKRSLEPLELPRESLDASLAAPDQEETDEETYGSHFA